MTISRNEVCERSDGTREGLTSERAPSGGRPWSDMRRVSRNLQPPGSIPQQAHRRNAQKLLPLARGMRAAWTAATSCTSKRASTSANDCLTICTSGSRTRPPREDATGGGARSSRARSISRNKCSQRSDEICKGASVCPTERAIMGKIYWRGLLLGGRRAAVVGGLVVLGATTPIACSGGPDAPAARSKSTPTLGGNATHAIHVFAGQPGGPRTLLNFGPGTELSLHASPESSSSPDGGTGLTTAATIDTPGADINATAWALVARAALACNVAPESTAIQLPPWSYSTIFVTSLAGQYPDWYVYGFRVQGNTINISPLENDCADRLLLEQNLICTADKLAQISDAVGDVVWPAATNGLRLRPRRWRDRSGRMPVRKSMGHSAASR